MGRDRTIDFWSAAIHRRFSVRSAPSLVKGGLAQIIYEVATLARAWTVLGRGPRSGDHSYMLDTEFISHATG